MSICRKVEASCLNSKRACTSRLSIRPLVCLGMTLLCMCQSKLHLRAVTCVATWFKWHQYRSCHSTCTIFLHARPANRHTHNNRQAPVVVNLTPDAASHLHFSDRGAQVLWATSRARPLSRPCDSFSFGWGPTTSAACMCPLFRSWAWWASRRPSPRSTACRSSGLLACRRIYWHADQPIRWEPLPGKSW